MAFKRSAHRILTPVCNRGTGDGSGTSVFPGNPRYREMPCCPGNGKVLTQFVTGLPGMIPGTFVFPGIGRCPGTPVLLSPVQTPVHRHTEPRLKPRFFLAKNRAGAGVPVPKNHRGFTGAGTGTPVVP